MTCRVQNAPTIGGEKVVVTLISSATSVPAFILPLSSCISSYLEISVARFFLISNQFFKTRNWMKIKSLMFRHYIALSGKARKKLGQDSEFKNYLKLYNHCSHHQFGMRLHSRNILFLSKNIHKHH